MNLSVPVISVIVGAVVLFAGRKLFWLFVAALGFAVGLEIAQYIMRDPPVWMALSIALVLGFAGALIAILLQKVAIAIAGFVGGGRVAVSLASAFFVNYAHYHAVIFLAGGVIGALLLLALFDWALIVLSAIEGAHLIRSGIVLPERGGEILFIALAALGIVVQAAMFRRRH